MLRSKSKRSRNWRTILLISVGLFFGCGLLSRLAPEPKVQQAEALAPPVVATFTNTPLPIQAPTETSPSIRLLVATDTPIAATSTPAPLPTLPPPLPTDTETPAPAPTEAQPTATPETVKFVTAPIQAAPVLENGSSCDCSGDTYRCDDFASHLEAQACFDYCMALGVGDIHRLDNDEDLSVCENR